MLPLPGSGPAPGPGADAVPPSTQGGTEDEVAAVAEEDEAEIVDPGVKEVDLVERLHDALVLEMPLRIYCKPDCLGLCPRCGEDRNRVACSCADQVDDPRWEVLAQLKQQTSQRS